MRLAACWSLGGDCVGCGDLTSTDAGGQSEETGADVSGIYSDGEHHLQADLEKPDRHEAILTYAGGLDSETWSA
jgi:hypothetical protein